MSVYDEIEIEDMEWVEEDRTFYYPCPCGDRFEILLEDLLMGEEIARCPSCSLTIRIIYDEEFLAQYANLN
ncbi:hypothetical protein SteCoe_9277 [Stentor coeruleus]|uniref:Diphthamide biosynthesis protein 3 n=1 Tax=Stentor coeruleus TaxID=5963 RepID=A0A1R2CI78_9CILI|nr:hypothetical protein SteCoe_9277 [Stentor coeruleus]